MIYDLLKRMQFFCAIFLDSLNWKDFMYQKSSSLILWRENMKMIRIVIRGEIDIQEDELIQEKREV